MKIYTSPVTNRIQLLTEQEKEKNCGTCSIAFISVMNFLSNMSKEAENSAFTYSPKPRFEYNKPILSELVNVLSDEQKIKLEEVGVEFRKLAGSSTRVHMYFVAKS